MFDKLNKLHPNSDIFNKPYLMIKGIRGYVRSKIIFSHGKAKRIASEMNCLLLTK